VRTAARQRSSGSIRNLPGCEVIADDVQFLGRPRQSESAEAPEPQLELEDELASWPSSSRPGGTCRRGFSCAWTTEFAQERRLRRGGARLVKGLVWRAAERLIKDPRCPQFALQIGSARPASRRLRRP
jgi:hypothetical protein